MELILVRHGETAWNRSRTIQGCRSETELSAVGEEQAARVAGWAAGRGLDALYSSPLKRALDTAWLIGRASGLDVEIAPGELEGLCADDMGEEHKGFWRAWRDGKLHVPLPGGESLEEVQRRAWAEIEGILSKHAEQRVVVVAHFFPILAVICRALGIELANTARMRLEPGSVSALDLSPDTSCLLLFNDMCHLGHG